MISNETIVKFQIDCCSIVNQIPESVEVETPKGWRKMLDNFYLVKANLRHLLEKKICDCIGLITVNFNKFYFAAVENHIYIYLKNCKRNFIQFILCQMCTQFEKHFDGTIILAHWCYGQVVS